jgi:hypothetical protein
MTIRQGEQINKSYEINKNKIDSLNKVNDSILIASDSTKKVLILKASEYRLRYEERLNMPIKYKYHDDEWDFIQKMALILVIVVQFFTINN